MTYLINVVIIAGKISDAKVNVNRGQIVPITSSKVSDVTVLERCRCDNEVTINADVFRMGAGLVGDNQAGSVYLEKGSFIQYRSDVTAQGEDPYWAKCEEILQYRTK